MANYTLNYSGAEVDALLNKIDTAFGEETVMGDTLTWDGSMEGAIEFSAMGEGTYLVKLSDTIPTLEELANGGSATGVVGTLEFTNYADDGSGMLMAVNESWDEPDNVMCCPMIFATETDFEGVIVPKGVYAFYMEGFILCESFTINNYTSFEMTEVKTIDEKYLPATSNIAITVEDYSYDSTTGSTGTVTCSKTFDELWGMSDVSLLNAVATITPADGYKFVARVAIASKATNDNNPDNIVQLIDFNFPVGIRNGVMHFADVVLTKDGTVGVM